MRNDAGPRHFGGQNCFSLVPFTENNPGFVGWHQFL